RGVRLAADGSVLDTFSLGTFDASGLLHDLAPDGDRLVTTWTTRGGDVTVRRVDLGATPAPQPPQPLGPGSSPVIATRGGVGIAAMSRTGPGGLGWARLDLASD